MFGIDDNPGGSFEANGKKLNNYLKGYKRMGNHVKRYDFARSYVRGKDVIEFGCGYGAGSVLLDADIKNYIGIDIDENAVSYAKNNIESIYKNTHFFTLDDFLNLSPPIKADVVLCFEVIEHVKDPNALISTLKSMTKKNGTILLSTPNGLSSNGNVALFRSKFHIYEYSPMEFHNILKSHGNVSYYGEKRIDSLDVRSLITRAKYVQEEVDFKRNSLVTQVNPLLFNIAYKFFNNSLYWKIYLIDPLKENMLHYSTSIAVLNIKEGNEN